MHQEPEHEDYDDDDYKYYPDSYGYSKKFKIDWAAWEQWLSKAMKDLYADDEYLKTTNFSDKYFMYLGKNSYSEPVWKAKYFINQKLEIEYKNHIKSNAVHFLKQPIYYRGLFDNIN